MQARKEKVKKYHSDARFSILFSFLIVFNYFQVWKTDFFAWKIVVY